MSFSVHSAEDLQAFMNVTVESLAGFCGLSVDEAQPALSGSLMMLKRQVDSKHS
jgi:hypothetical protein